MCCRPTVARGRRQSAGPTWLSTMPAADCFRLALIESHPLREHLAAVSVGIVDGVPMLDLDYSEDSRAQVDMNVVMTELRAVRRGAGNRRRAAIQSCRARRAARYSRSRDPPVGPARGGVALGRARFAPAGVTGGRFFLATANPDKAAEIVAMLAAALPEVDLLPRPPDLPEVAETGESLTENARIKALALVALTGEAAIADDTGLEVEALGGAPGVRTARYAGEGASYGDNVAKLLEALAGVPIERRRARFVTVALARFPDGSELVAEGAVVGRIAFARRGGAGFGYDPVFEPDGGDGRTFSEMTTGEKEAISHRGRAFRALAAQLSGQH